MKLCEVLHLEKVQNGNTNSKLGDCCSFSFLGGIFLCSIYDFQELRYISTKGLKINFICYRGGRFFEGGGYHSSIYGMN